MSNFWGAVQNYRRSFHMSKRSPKSVEEKLELVQLYQEQGVSISTLVSSYGVASTTIKKWIRKYENSGIDGLKESRT
ncbi:transposase, partial [Streptococcus equi]|uniref:transposase n=1 Tax=Streptococcus equi TaxID=1336 RepID=UPI003D156378